MSHLDFYCRICGSKNCTASHVAMRVKNDDPKPDNHDDPVNHPSHYTESPAKCKCGKRIECIQITEHMEFCLGNALKYIWRADLKGNAIQDLEKAKWYIEREIQKRSQSDQ